jgi:hypothetical protein
MSQQAHAISPDGNNKPKSAIFNGILFEVGTFMNIDGELYNVFEIWEDLYRFGGRIDVVLRINLRDKNKNSKILYFTIDKYWLFGNSSNPKPIPELKYEVIVSMTDEQFYVKPATPVTTTPVTTTPYDPTRYCSGGRDSCI